MFFLLTAQIRYFIGPNLLDHKDHKVLRVPKALKAQLVLKAQLDHKVLKALLELKVQLQPLLDHKDHKELLGLKVRRDLRCKAHKARKELLATKDPKARKVLLGLKAQLHQFLAHKAQPVLKAQLDHKDRAQIKH
jgi:hypothetical protein